MHVLAMVRADSGKAFVAIPPTAPDALAFAAEIAALAPAGFHDETEWSVIEAESTRSVKA